MKRLTFNWLAYMRHGSTVLLSLTLPHILLGQDTTPGATEVVDQNLNLWGLIQQGGWAMYPLGTCSLIMFFLIFYSWKETAQTKFFTTDQLSATIDALESGDHDKGSSQL